MDWRMHRNPVSPLAPFAHLLRARTAADGIAAMRDLPEPALNLVVADDAGRVAYHFAGQVPLDPSWGRWASDGDAPEPAYLAFDRAPHVDPSRAALVVTSNNRSDGDGSPRLAPWWPPPYRAFEIEHALAAAAGARGKLSPDALAREQLDAASPAERELATMLLASASREARGRRRVARAAARARCARSTARSSPESRGATAVVAVRRDMLGAISAAHLPGELAKVYPSTGPGFEVVLRALRERPRGWVPNDDYDAFAVASLRRVQTALGAGDPGVRHVRRAAAQARARAVRVHVLERSDDAGPRRQLRAVRAVERARAVVPRGLDRRRLGQRHDRHRRRRIGRTGLAALRRPERARG